MGLAPRQALRRLLGPRRRRFLAPPVFVEVFSGEGVLAAALRKEGALVIEWDIAWGADWDLTRPSVARVLRGLSSNIAIALLRERERKRERENFYYYYYYYLGIIS